MHITVGLAWEFHQAILSPKIPWKEESKDADESFGNAVDHEGMILREATALTDEVAKREPSHK